MSTEQPSRDPLTNAAGAGPGRRAGNPDTRETIVEAAHRAFTTTGFRGSTAKSIADEAGVDPAMINYFFGSKQGLFRAVLARNHDPTARRDEIAELTDPPSPDAPAGSDFSERLVRQALRTWDDKDTRELLTGLIMSADEDEQTAQLVRTVGESTSDVIETHLTNQGMLAEQAAQRSALIVAMNAGLVYGRYILRTPTLAAMSADELVAQYAPAIRALTHP